MKAEVQGLGAVKESHWGVQSMEVRVLIWVSEHCFGRWRMGFSRQQYWSGLPFPSPGDLPDQEIEPRSPAL